MYMNRCLNDFTTNRCGAVVEIELGTSIALET